jgi:hypothetical protein
MPKNVTGTERGVRPIGDWSTATARRRLLPPFRLWVAPPQRSGFGRRLIERGLAHELGAEVGLDFTPAGLQCRIRLPLSAKVAVGPVGG